MGDLAYDADESAAIRNDKIELTILLRTNNIEASIKHAQMQYQSNKDALVGSTIVCPSCGKRFIKSQYNKLFCSNQTSSSQSNNCKDLYWNSTEPKRRQRGNDLLKAKYERR